MIRAEDLKNGSVKPPKAHTSIIPFLRAEQAKNDTQTEHKAELTVKDAEPEDKQDLEVLKTSLKHIHSSATEAELEIMAKEVMG